MPAFLVTWNASTASWPNYESDQAASARGRIVKSDWSFRNRPESPRGSAVYMLRQKSDRGIMASGVVISDIYERNHWDETVGDRDTTYVDIAWDVILPISERLRIEDLLANVPGRKWNYVLNSGQELKAPVDDALEAYWRDHLARLGNESPVAVVEWDLEPGSIVTRSEVAARFGGATQGGIQPSSSTPNVMIYSDPLVGHAHGYKFDGPADGAYYYTGEGQVGDQLLRAGNKAIVEHEGAGRILRLFEAAGPNRKGGKPQRYLGAYAVDSADPYRFERATDRNGNDRAVIVFRLLPAGTAVESSHLVVASVNQPETVCELVPTEVNTQELFEVSEMQRREGVRWESSLMRQLEQHLEKQGHEVKRVAIIPAGDRARLITDTFDVTDSELFEIKPSASRSHVRMAVAQLLDYRRHVPQAVRATVLLPVAPSDDLRNFIHSAGLQLAIFHDDQLTRLTQIE